MQELARDSSSRGERWRHPDQSEPASAEGWAVAFLDEAGCEASGKPTWASQRPLFVSRALRGVDPQARGPHRKRRAPQ